MEQTSPDSYDATCRWEIPKRYVQWHDSFLWAARRYSFAVGDLGLGRAFSFLAMSLEGQSMQAVYCLIYISLVVVVTPVLNLQSAKNLYLRYFPLLCAPRCSCESPNPVLYFYGPRCLALNHCGIFDQHNRSIVLRAQASRTGRLLCKISTSIKMARTIFAVSIRIELLSLSSATFAIRPWCHLP